MIAIATFLRRTAAALGAITALTATGVATAQTVTLTGASGSSCTYSQMTVLPNGNVAVTCSSVANPGTFTLTAPTSLPVSSQTTATQVRINRAGGSAGDVTIGFSLSGTNGCTSATGTPITFVDGDVTAKPIIIDTTATTPGTCIVTLLSPSAGSLGSPSSKNMSVVDPDAPVAFGFAASSSAAAVGSSAVQMVVTRTGGTNNAWTVPVTLSGSLTAAGAMIAGAGTVSPTTLNFAANSSQAVVTYTPPLATPAAPALPASVTLLLGAPDSATAPPSQTGSITPGATTHTVTLNGPAVGCPVPETIANSMLAAYANGTTLRMPSGTIATFVLPAPTLNKSTGQFYIAAGTSTYPVAPYYFEIHINKCKGLVQATTGDTCYAKFATKTGYYGKVWFTKTLPTNASYDTVAEIKARGYCYAPATEGPWYVNIRYTYAGCDISGNCGWNYQWQNWTY
jgi:hypothetical protein